MTCLYPHRPQNGSAVLRQPTAFLINGSSSPDELSESESSSTSSSLDDSTLPYSSTAQCGEVWLKQPSAQRERERECTTRTVDLYFAFSASDSPRQAAPRSLPSSPNDAPGFSSLIRLRFLLAKIMYADSGRFDFLPFLVLRLLVAALLRLPEP